MNNKNIALILTTFALSACTGSLGNLISDRTPDYRTSGSTSPLELPPDLSGDSLHENLDIPTLAQSGIGSYNAYVKAHAQRDSRGFISVLPPLHGVQVIDTPNQLPYLVVDADPSYSWHIVKRFLVDNGIAVAKEDPSIGVMETDWLVDKNKIPKSGLGGLIDGILSFASDSGERDRYRLRFSRTSDNKTQILVIYAQAEETLNYDGPNKKDYTGYSWAVTDNKNPELQLEMTRRLALYIAQQLELKNNDTTQQQNSPRSTALSPITLPDGTPALVINQPYRQAWQTLNQALTHASYAVINANIDQGSMVINHHAKAKNSLFNAFFSSKNKKPSPNYLLRLADKGQSSIAVVQSFSGEAMPKQLAKAILGSLTATTNP